MTDLNQKLITVLHNLLSESESNLRMLQVAFGSEMWDQQPQFIQTIAPDPTCNYAAYKTSVAVGDVPDDEDNQDNGSFGSMPTHCGTLESRIAEVLNGTALLMLTGWADLEEKYDYNRGTMMKIDVARNIFQMVRVDWEVPETEQYLQFNHPLWETSPIMFLDILLGVWGTK